MDEVCIPLRPSLSEYLPLQDSVLVLVGGCRREPRLHICIYSHSLSCILRWLEIYVGVAERVVNRNARAFAFRNDTLSSCFTSEVPLCQLHSQRFPSVSNNRQDWLKKSCNCVWPWIPSWKLFHLALLCMHHPPRTHNTLILSRKAEAYLATVIIGRIWI